MASDCRCFPCPHYPPPNEQSETEAEAVLEQLDRPLREVHLNLLRLGQHVDGLIQQLLPVPLDDPAVQKDSFVVLRADPAVQCVFEPRKSEHAHVDVLQERPSVQFLGVTHNVAYRRLIRQTTRAKRVFGPSCKCGLRIVLSTFFLLLYSS